MAPNNFSGMRVTVMGLGLHGGGVATARYCAERGAEVTVTDLRSEEVLHKSVEALEGVSVRFILGSHEKRDFTDADMVIKNPAVRRNVPLLAEARRIETDISLFLAASENPLVAVTGTKGKSSTASAIHHILLGYNPAARLGGNITRSPLTFLSEIDSTSPVVLELSSFQLGDLVFAKEHNERYGSRPEGFSPTHDPIDPRVAVITNIYRDHQDYYGSMERYVSDKKAIYRTQSDGWAVFTAEDSYGTSFAAECPGQPILVCSEGQQAPEQAGRMYDHNGWGTLSIATHRIPLVPPRLQVPGVHQRRNALTAAAAAYVAGTPAELVKARIGGFRGIPHRLAFVGSAGGARYYNDSAATIPEATLAAVRSFTKPVTLICGGTDKELELQPLALAAAEANRCYLLAGSATDRLLPLLQERGVAFEGPFNDLGQLLKSCLKGTVPGKGQVVLFSPGCASFELFQNEFDRGNRFVSLLGELGISS